MKKKIIWLVVGLIVGYYLWLLAPNTNLPFSLIDDPLFAKKALLFKNQLVSGQAIDSVNTFLHAFPGLDQGRFALTWLVWWMKSFFIFGLNPQALHLILATTVALGAIGLYLAVERLSRSRWPVLISVLFYSILALGYESWLRFSPQEAIQTLSLMVLLFILLKRDKFDWVGQVGLLVFLFSKENSLLLSPSLFLSSFLLDDEELSKRFNKAGRWGMFYGAIILFVWWLGLRSPDNWAGESASLSNVIPSLKTYFSNLKRLWVVHLTGLSIVGGIYFWFKKPKTRGMLRRAGIYLLMAGFSLGALLPWKFALVRYLMPLSILLSGFLGIVWYLIGKESIKLLTKKRRILLSLSFLALSTLVMVKFVYVNFLELVSIKNNYLAREVNNYHFMKRVSQLPADSKLVINVYEDNLYAREWVQRMPLYLEVFYNRDDIRAEYLETDKDNVEAGEYLGQWSLYKSDYKPEGELIWKDSLLAKEIKVGLKDLVLTKTGIRSGEIWGGREYSWKLYKYD